jgi:hypothetical protein
MNRHFICLGFAFTWLAIGSATDSRAQSVAYGNGGSHVIATEVQADVLIRNNTQVQVRSNGWIRSHLFDPAGAGVRVIDTSRLSMTGGDIWGTTSGPGQATGAWLQNSARFEMTAGTVRGTTSGPGDAFGIRAEGSSLISIKGGEVRATTSEPGDSIGILLDGNSSLHMTGGTVYAITNGPLAFGIVANDLARVKISGGEFATFASSSNIDLVANETSRIAIVGTSPNYRQGVPIAALSGQINWLSASGKSFYYSFKRSASATIVLVPEPASGALAVMSLLLSFLIRPRTGRA